MKPNKIRVGLLIDDFEIPLWQSQMLSNIRDSYYAQIVLVVLNDSLPSKKANGFISGISSKWRGSLYKKYLKYEKKRHNISLDAFDIENSSELLKDIYVLKSIPIHDEYSDKFLKTDVSQIENYNLDVIIRLGFRELKGDILTVAKFGVWSFHYCSKTTNRFGPPSFWEVFENLPVTGTMLQVMAEEPENGKILCKSYSATHQISVAISRNTCHWKSSLFIPRKLKELYEARGNNFRNNLKTANAKFDFYSDHHFIIPTNLKFIYALLKHLFKYLKIRLCKLVYFEQWSLLFNLDSNTSNTFQHYKKIIPPKDRFWADPFIIENKGYYYIFIEEFEFKRGKGHISLLVMDKNGGYKKPVKILERPFHLSYPFIFEYKDNFYMIPDTLENKTVEIYKCIEFPDKWEFHKTLIDNISAVDATLFFHNNKWWMFANVMEIDEMSSWDELFLYYADNPLSDNWTPHPMNPIVSDVRKSRPAGNIFMKDGIIYRPSQNSSGGYGNSLVFNKILKLTETEYKEVISSKVEPNWDNKLLGIHTFNYNSGLTIIDGKIRRLKFF